MNKRIKILYIAPTLDQGGAERFLTDLLIHLDKEKFSPYLLLFKRGGLWLSEITAENIPVKILNKRWHFDLINFWQIFKFIRNLRPDIVHTQLGGDVYGRLAARLAGIKTIISTEQNVNPDETWLANFLKKSAAKYSKMTVAITEAVRADAMKRYNLTPEKTIIIPNGIDVKKFTLSRNDSCQEKEGLIFGTIGRLSKQKGHSYLIEAISLAKNSTKYLIAGTGDLQLKLEKQIDDLNLADRVKLVGLVDNIPAFLASLDAFVFPSVWEGQGIVLMEAGLSRLPIIASAVDGIKEVLDEETAWLVPAQNPSALAEKLIWLNDNINSSIVKEKTEKLYNRILECYSLERVVESYESLYDKILTDKL